MKYLITLLIALLISLSSFAQQGINYKAQLKDTNGNVLAGIYMTVLFTIHETTATGTIVYQEDHNYTTDANGLLILEIGTDSSPSVGPFTSINWDVHQHFLQTTITYSGGTINFDATEFMAVPYAKHAETANNVFSGDYNDLINQPTIIPSTGLEQIAEQNPVTGGFRTGRALTERVPENYGPIGTKAIDLSYSNFSSTVRGATGTFSTAMGLNTEASGVRSTAMEGIQAESHTSTAIGRYNRGGFTDNAGTNNDGDINWLAADPLFEIGNGSSDSDRNNALTVLKNGNAIFDGEIQHTTTGNANMIPIAYGTVESNGNILSGTGNFTASVDINNIFSITVTGETLYASNSSCSIVPYSTSPRTSSIIHSGGDLKVYIFNSSGTQVASTFQFVIYKL